jgi:hypothetical protein
MDLSAPEWFLKELNLFDPDLRVRWSAKMQLFQLERKIAHSKIVETTKQDIYDDDYLRAKDGYVLVALIQPGKFSRTIFETLRASDLWNNGGWEAVARHIEDLEAREEEKKWEAFTDDVKYHTKELYDFLAIRDGRRILNVGFPV